MRLSVLVLPALSAVALAAPAPSLPEFNVQAAMPDGLEYLSDYFNLLAKKVQAVRFMSVAPICSIKEAKLPQASNDTFPAPSKGLVVKHVAIGRGTQNYTCEVGNSTAAPVANGAVATLFDASCVAATYPDLLDMLPRVALQFNLAKDENSQLGPTNLAVSGIHFFTPDLVPFFNLDSERGQLGHILVQKNASAAAPADASSGPKGEPAVAWLKLDAKGEATGNLKEVFRVGTAGGSAPKTCEGMPANFEVEYASQYWFYEGN